MGVFWLVFFRPIISPRGFREGASLQRFKKPQRVYGIRGRDFDHFGLNVGKDFYSFSLKLVEGAILGARSKTCYKKSFILARNWIRVSKFLLDLSCINIVLSVFSQSI